MLKDPCTRWHGPFPYDVLEGVGITPASSMEEVLDATFELMARDEMTREARQAWDAVRTVENRMVVDFFLYRVDLCAEVERTLSTMRQSGLTIPEDLESLPLPDPGDPQVVERILALHGGGREQCDGEYPQEDRDGSGSF